MPSVATPKKNYGPLGSAAKFIEVTRNQGNPNASQVQPGTVPIPGTGASTRPPAAAANPNAPPTDQLDPNVEAGIREQFGVERTRASARAAEASRQTGQFLNRQQAITGNAGGAFAKLGTQAEAALSRQAGEEQQAIGAAESGAIAEKRFAAQEQEKQRVFTAEQSKFARDLQSNLFDKELDFRLQELSETKRSNYINSIIALKEAELANDGDFAEMLAGLEFLGGLPEGIGSKNFMYMSPARNRPSRAPKVPK